MTIRSLVILSLTVSVLLGGAPASAQQSKCVAGKTKCMSTKSNGLLKCHTLAETPGKPADPNANGCIDKVVAKFESPSNPPKGCFEKLESKATNDCLTFDDTVAAEAVVDSCIGAFVAAVDPPPLTQSKCGAGKKKCVSKLTVGLLKCYTLAQTPGKSPDPNAKDCITKALGKYDGGADPSKGCFAKLEAKVPNDCETLGDSGSVKTLVQTCVEGMVEFVETPPTSTSSSTTIPPPPTTTTSTTTSTSVPSTVTTSTSTSTSTSSSSTSTSSSSSTSTSSSTTVSTTTSSTTSTIAALPTILDFTTTIGGGVCGRTFTNTSGIGTPLSTISCGGLKLGGGASFINENVTPDGSTNRMGLACSGTACFVIAQPSVTADYDCSEAGCRFGVPLALSAGGISSCILNTFSSNVNGTLNLATGAASLNIVLNSATYVTGNDTRPCPVCVDGADVALVGSPSSPQTGVCSRGPNAGQACVTRNSQGLSHDCQPDGTFSGDIPISLSPAVTSQRVQTSQTRTFCAGQNPGCFNGGTNCRRIEVDGQVAGALTLNTPSAVRLSSIFCVGSTTNPTVNISADLPGPGATVLVGTFTTRP